MTSKSKVLKFWLDNLKDWDKKRYDRKLNINPIYARHLHAIEVLRPYIKGKRILELGCGTGRLAEPLVSLGALSWTGVDIGNFKEESSSIKFIKSSIGELIYKDDYDIIISLGLLDWLENDDIKKVFILSKDKIFFHTFSLNQKSIFLTMHRCFAKFRYKKNFDVSPRVFTKQEIYQFINPNTEVNFLSSYRTLFSVAITNIIE